MEAQPQGKETSPCHPEAMPALGKGSQWSWSRRKNQKTWTPQTSVSHRPGLVVGMLRLDCHRPHGTWLEGHQPQGKAVWLSS